MLTSVGSLCTPSCSFVSASGEDCRTQSAVTMPRHSLALVTKPALAVCSGFRKSYTPKKSAFHAPPALPRMRRSAFTPYSDCTPASSVASRPGSGLRPRSTKGSSSTPKVVPSGSP